MRVRRGWKAWIVSSLALGLLACGGGGGGGPEGLVGPPVGPPVFEPFQEAKVVFGQPVFVFNDANQGAPAPGPGTLACPGVPGVGPLFVPDSENHRVLGFAQTPILNNLHANFVLGQPDFQFDLPGLGATAMHEPTSACVDGGRLYVVDSGNHRVLVFGSVPTSKGAAAQAAVGQPDLVTALPAAGRSGLRAPTCLALGGGKVAISDSGNHRVLLWLGADIASGAPADVVLGQADFDGSLPNRGIATGRDTMADPYGVWTDGVRLIVADRGNNRVLLWNTFPRTNGQPADVILGQFDGTSSEALPPDVGLRRPCSVDCDGTRLYVADAGNHRVLVFDGLPEADGAPAQDVIGQSGFEFVAPNDDDQDGSEDAVPSARTFKSKDGILTVRVDGRTLFVGDSGNHRLLVFESR